MAFGVCLIFAAALAGGINAEDCRDSLLIDSTAYEIPEYWCPRKVPDSAKADPATLVQLPTECTFEDYRIYAEKPARDAFVRMAEAARQDSVELIADSGFRSPGFQRRIIKQRLETGQPIDKILTHVAPPGYSEHHTGRAFDLVPSEALFAQGKAYRWLGANAGRFGFVESFPEGSPDGPAWEPWHWLYVGSDPGIDTTAQDDPNVN